MKHRKPSIAKTEGQQDEEIDIEPQDKAPQDEGPQLQGAEADEDGLWPPLDAMRRWLQDN